MLTFLPSHWSIRETVTFLDPGFHETKQEEFDGDRPASFIKRHQKIGIILCG